MFHEQQWQKLCTLFAQNALPSFWIFAGEKGIGKATFAKAFAHFVLSSTSTLNAETIRQQIANNVYPNCHCIDVLEKEGVIPVVHNFLETTAHTPGWRVLILDNFNEMNHFIANALLKSFETNYDKVLIILIIHNLNPVLSSIKSRFFYHYFYPIPEEQFPEALQDVAQYAGGSLGMAQAMQALGGLRFIETLQEEMFNNPYTPSGFIERYQEHHEVVIHCVKILLYKRKDKKTCQQYERINNFCIESANAHLKGVERLTTVYFLLQM